MILIDYQGHMVSDLSLDELHAFATRIGLKRRWFQDKRIPHYDVTSEEKRELAIFYGARFVIPQEIVEKAVRR